MNYRTCCGCVTEGQTCEARDRVRAQIRGLGVTSIRWKCGHRIPRFVVGDPVWAQTVTDHAGEYVDGEQFRDDYPAVVIRDLGSKMLVFIESGAPGRDYGDGAPFQPSRNGFCKVSLSRITKRDGERVDVCPYCEWPAPKGHQDGYSCSIATTRKSVA